MGGRNPFQEAFPIAPFSFPGRRLAILSGRLDGPHDACFAPPEVEKGSIMSGNPNIRRMTLRQLLTSAEKCSRDLAEQLQSTLLPRATDCRDLSRPVRRRSHFPTVVAVANSLNKLDEAYSEMDSLIDFLMEQMEAIREAARKERFRR